MERESIIIGTDIGIRLPRVKDGSVISGGAAGFSMSRARDFSGETFLATVASTPFA